MNRSVELHGVFAGPGQQLLMDFKSVLRSFSRNRQIKAAGRRRIVRKRVYRRGFTLTYSLNSRGNPVPHHSRPTRTIMLNLLDAELAQPATPLPARRPNLTAKALSGLALGAPALGMLMMAGKASAQTNVTSAAALGVPNTASFGNAIRIYNSVTTGGFIFGAEAQVFNFDRYGPSSSFNRFGARARGFVLGNSGSFPIVTNSFKQTGAGSFAAAGLGPSNVQTTTFSVMNGGNTGVAQFRFRIASDGTPVNTNALSELLGFGVHDGVNVIASGGDTSALGLPGGAPPAGRGGEEPIVVPGQSDQGSPVVAVIPQSDPVNPDPVTIIDVGAQMSAQTTGQATISAVNGGAAGTFRGWASGTRSRLRGITGLSGFNGLSFHRPNPALNIQIAGAEERWTGAIHPFAGVAQSPIVVNTSPRNWQLYTGGSFNLQEQERIGLDPGYDSEAYSGVVGVERFMTQQLLVGFAATLGRNNIESARATGNADIDGLMLDAYAVYAKDDFWTNLRYGVGFFDIDVTRNAFRNVTARANTDSLSHVVGWGAGINREAELFGMKVIHGPNIGLDYTTGKIDGYTETGGGAFNLIVDEHSYSSLLSEVGWSVAREHDLGKLGRGFIQLRAGWNREHLNSESNTEFEFETSPITIFDPATGSSREGPTVRGQSHNATPQNDYMSLGLHLTHYLGEQERVQLNAGYQTQVFRDDFSEHYGYVKIGISF